MEYVCPQCGKTFYDRHKNRRYCSRECYHTAKGAAPKKYTCEVCGKTFTRYPSYHARYEHAYCSRACSDIGHRTRFTIACRWCGTEFVVTPTEYTNGRRLCSWECRVAEKADAKNRICEVCGGEFVVPFPSRKTATCSEKCRQEKRKRGKYIHCKVCNKRIWTMPCHFSTRRFCSRTCQGRWQSEHMRGENAPNWHGGTGNLPYPSEWTEALKSSIRERDGNTCAECGSTDNLSVHHINYDKSNCSEINLITLCIPCNSRANFHRKSWQARYEAMIDEIYTS